MHSVPIPSDTKSYWRADQPGFQQFVGSKILLLNTTWPAARYDPSGYTGRWPVMEGEWEPQLPKPSDMIQLKQSLTFQKLDLDRHPRLLVWRWKRNPKKQKKKDISEHQSSGVQVGEQAVRIHLLLKSFKSGSCLYSVLGENRTSLNLSLIS